MRSPSARPIWSLKSPGTLNLPELKIPFWMKVARVHLAACVLALAFAAFLHQMWLFYVTGGAAGWDGVTHLMVAAHMWKGGGPIAERARRKSQGMAPRSEIRSRMSPAAVRKRASVTRPATDVRRLPHSEIGVHIGRSAGRMAHQRLMGTWEDFYLVFAGPRTGKTGWFASVVLDACGAVVSTSTRCDVLAHTILARQEAGPVYVLNPGNDAGISSTLLWSPVAGCDNPAVAIDHAGYLMAAAPKDSSGKDAWWDAQGVKLLRVMMHAAALVNADMMKVKAWVDNPADPEPLDILRRHPCAAPGWAADLEKLVTQAKDDPEFMQNVSRSADTALAWLADPEMQRISCPSPDEAFSPAQFILSGATLYMIGADRPHSSLTPYFSCLIAEIYNTAKRIAAASIGLRLDPPLLMVIDEPALCFRGRLDQMVAESGGHGITVVTGVQSPAQLAEVWGENGGKIIRDLASVKLYFGGMTDSAELEALSKVCGPIDSWQIIHGPDGRIKQPVQVPLLTEARLRTLTPGQAVLLSRSARPVLASIDAVWKRKGYEPATLADYVWATDEETEMLSLEHSQ